MMSGFSNRGTMMGQPPIISKSTPEVSIQNIESMSNVFHPTAEKAAFFPSKNDKIVVSDNDDDEDDDDSDTEYEGDDDDVASNEDGEDESDSDENAIMEDDEYDPSINFEAAADNDEDMVADSKIKIVNMDVHEPLNVDSLKDDFENLDSDSMGNLEEIVEIPELSEEKEVLHVEKIPVSEEMNESEKDSGIDNENPVENSKDIYLKMSVNELRKVAITKGLCSDASKMKKYDLMKLLEVI
jgi:hypothetical protein